MDRGNFQASVRANQRKVRGEYLEHRLSERPTFTMYCGDGWAGRLPKSAASEDCSDAVPRKGSIDAILHSGRPQRSTGDIWARMRGKAERYRGDEIEVDATDQRGTGGGTSGYHPRSTHHWLLHENRVEIHVYGTHLSWRRAAQALGRRMHCSKIPKLGNPFRKTTHSKNSMGSRNAHENRGNVRTIGPSSRRPV